MRVLLDACILVHHRKLDLLLYLAAAGHFQPLWSEAILDEADRALVDDLGWERRLVASRRQAMTVHFEQAAVTGYEGLVVRMTNDPGDRHVLAAAVAGGAKWLVTENLKHFRRQDTIPHGIEALRAVDFVKMLRRRLPVEVDEILEARALNYGVDLHDYLESIGSEFTSIHQS